MPNDDGTIDLTGDDAADWLIRSALPLFLRLVALDDDADYFAGLPPFEHSSTGRIRGWRGASKRLAALEKQLFNVRADAYAVTAGSPRIGIREPTDAQVQARAAANFARRRMRPSRTGWAAVRLIGEAGSIAETMSVLSDDGYDVIDEVWQEAFTALADRARLREVEYAAALGAGE